MRLDAVFSNLSGDIIVLRAPLRVKPAAGAHLNQRPSRPVLSCSLSQRVLSFQANKPSRFWVLLGVRLQHNVTQLVTGTVIHKTLNAHRQNAPLLDVPTRLPRRFKGTVSHCRGPPQLHWDVKGATLCGHLHNVRGVPTCDFNFTHWRYVMIRLF